MAGFVRVEGREKSPSVPCSLKMAGHSRGVYIEKGEQKVLEGINTVV